MNDEATKAREGASSDDGVANPEHGARFVFERLRAGDAGAFVYEVSIHGPSVTFRAPVVTSDAMIAPDAWHDAQSGERRAPEPWMLQTVNALWKTLRARHAAEPESGWPRRITRWRSRER